MRGSGVTIPVNLEAVFNQNSKSRVTKEYKEMVRAILEMAKNAGYKTDQLFKVDGTIKSYKQAATYITELGATIGAVMDANTKKIQSFSAAISQLQGGTRSANFKFNGSSLFDKKGNLKSYDEYVSGKTTDYLSSYKAKIGELKAAQLDYDRAVARIQNSEDERLKNKENRLAEIKRELDEINREGAAKGIGGYQQGALALTGDSLKARTARALAHDYEKQLENTSIERDARIAKEQQQNLNQLISLQGQYNNAIREGNIYTKSAQQASELLVESLAQAGIQVNTEALAQGRIEIDNLNQAAQALNMTEEQLALKLDTTNAKFESSQITEYINKLQLLHNAQIEVARLTNAKASDEQIEIAKTTVNSLKAEVDGFKALNPKIVENAKNLGLVTKENNRYKTALADVNAQQKKTQSFFDSFKTSFKQMLTNVTQAGISWRIFAESQKLLKESINIVKELDKAITDLRIATGENADTVRSMLKEYNQLAQQLGATTVDVAKSADTWLRMGYSQQETNTLIKNSLILSKVGQLESAEATKYLVSTMKGFNVTAQESLSIIDKLSAVDLESATSAGGLAEALARTAKSAELAGVSIDKAIGYVAVVAETTQRDEATVGES